MEQYLKIVRQMMGKFEVVEVIQIPREQNSRVDIFGQDGSGSRPKNSKVDPFGGEVQPEHRVESGGAADITKMLVDGPDNFIP